MLNIENLLGEFIRTEMDKPPYPGACCRMADNWVMARLCFSPLHNYGRDFSNQSDVDGWLSEPGGLPIAVNRVMRKAGLKRTKTPRIGDVGLAISTGRVCMAILTPRGWLSRDGASFISAPKEHCRIAWRISELD